MPEYRLLVLGSAGVGKSALTVQFVNNIFVDVYNPTVEDSYRKQVTIDDQCYVLNILDTAGVEDFSAVRQHYTLSGHGFLIVYSITSTDSFSEVATIHQDILRIKDTDKVPLVVIGNKCDMESSRKVPTTECEAYCSKFGVPYFEVSAKTRVNVEEAFYCAVREIIMSQESLGENKTAASGKKKRACIVM